MSPNLSPGGPCRSDSSRATGVPAEETKTTPRSRCQKQIELSLSNKSSITHARPGKRSAIPSPSRTRSRTATQSLCCWNAARNDPLVARSEKRFPSTSNRRWIEVCPSHIRPAEHFDRIVSLTRFRRFALSDDLRVCALRNFRVSKGLVTPPKFRFEVGIPIRDVDSTGQQLPSKATRLRSQPACFDLEHVSVEKNHTHALPYAAGDARSKYRSHDGPDAATTSSLRDLWCVLTTVGQDQVTRRSDYAQPPVCGRSLSRRGHPCVCKSLPTSPPRARLH